MKLSWKFFCIAYIVILLSTGIGSAFLIQNSVNLVWESQMERVASSESYAITSFLSFANISSDKITEDEMPSIIRQTEDILDSCITSVSITPFTEETDKELLTLGTGEGFNRFAKEDGLFIMESICRVKSGNYEYFVGVKSDFSEIWDYRTQIWRIYSLAVFFIALISGIILYVFAKKATKPLGTLERAADDITAGNYGKTVDIKTSDAEIKGLSNSFNRMSVAMGDALNEIKKEAEKRDTFVANFTHEMKTPMTAIIGYADMLQSYPLTEDEKRQASDAIYKEGKRLEELSRQLLELFVTQNEEVELSPVSLMEIKGSLNKTLGIVAEKYGVSFLVELPDVMVKANRTLLLSLLYNLTDNAFKAVIFGDTVKIYGSIEKDKIKISVEDHGRGIAPEHIERLTEPFYREDKARSRAQGGAGLGLSLCKEIAAIHGTVLSFVSEKNKGTTVAFELNKAGEGGE